MKADLALALELVSDSEQATARGQATELAPATGWRPELHLLSRRNLQRPVKRTALQQRTGRYGGKLALGFLMRRRAQIFADATM